MEKEKALELALTSIEKQFGKGAIMRLGDKGANLDISVIPTGCFELDMALGIYGMPRGRIIEIYGPESSGKTTLALHVVAEAQKLGGAAAFIDVEHALDPSYAHNLGVDIDNLLVAQPDTGEQALEIMETLVRSGVDYLQGFYVAMPQPIPRRIDPQVKKEILEAAREAVSDAGKA